MKKKLTNEQHRKEFYGNIAHYHSQVLQEKKAYRKSFQRKFEQVKCKVK